MNWCWRGLVPYQAALSEQRAYRDQVLQGQAPEMLWMLEHPLVITTGRREVADLPSEIDVVHTERGGLATAHMPGQLVGYLFFDFASRGWRLRDLVCRIESGIISSLATLGITAHRHPEHRGVWVEGGKICALGLHVRKGVTMHGFALNLCPDLTVFREFTPCGISEGGVTSVGQVRGEAPGSVDFALTLGPEILACLIDDLR